MFFDFVDRAAHLLVGATKLLRYECHGIAPASVSPNKLGDTLVDNPLLELQAVEHIIIYKCAKEAFISTRSARTRG